MADFGINRKKVDRILGPFRPAIPCLVIRLMNISKYFLTVT